MKGILKSICNGLLMAGVLVLAISAQHCYAQDNDPQKILDMSQYKSADEAQTAFYKSYPKGSNVCPVVEYLEKNAKKTSSPFELYDFTFWGWVKEQAHELNPFVKEDGFFIQISQPDENIDVWRIHILHSGCRLTEAKFRLQYKDKNFAKRDIPFRFEYFEDTNLIGTVSAYYAANSIAAERKANFKDMEKIFRDAGSSEFRKGGGNTIKKTVSMGARYYPKRKIGSCKPWYVSIRTKEDGSLYYINGVMNPISVNPPYCMGL